jgi:hypothetical protein
VGSIYATSQHPGPGQLKIFGHVKEGSLIDPPGTRKGMVIRSLCRNVTDPRQTNPALLSDVAFCGGMSYVLNYGPDHVAMAVDISIALKNGSGEPGPFSQVISVILS